MNKTLIRGSLITILWGMVFWWWRNTGQTKHQFAVLPHFMIESHKLDPLWEEFASNLDGETPTILIISPDHFHVHKTNDQILTSGIKHICSRWYCFPTPKKWSFYPSRRHLTSDTLHINDHGIGVHFSFIQKYFPQAKVATILVQPYQHINQTYVRRNLQSLLRTETPTIVIASVDRSHYVHEPRALLHDYTSWSRLTDTQYWGHRLNQEDLDCPLCLTIIQSLASNYNLKPELVRRDSSASIFGTSDRQDNTSRLAIRYTSDPKNQRWSGLSLMFTRDPHWYDENNTKILSDTDHESALQSRYQQQDPSLSPRSFHHRKGASIDYGRRIFDPKNQRTDKQLRKMEELGLYGTSVHGQRVKNIDDRIHIQLGSDESTPCSISEHLPSLGVIWTKGDHIQPRRSACERDHLVLIGAGLTWDIEKNGAKAGSVYHIDTTLLAEPTLGLWLDRQHQLTIFTRLQD